MHVGDDADSERLGSDDRQTEGRAGPQDGKKSDPTMLVAHIDLPEFW
jgi:hypothetical protein